MSNLMTIKRDGQPVAFNAQKIVDAVRRAFTFDVAGAMRPDSNTAATRAAIDAVAEAAVKAVYAKAAREGVAVVRVEDCQDQVELALMRAGAHAVARDFVLFREKRAEKRRAATPPVAAVAATLRCVTPSGAILAIGEADLVATVVGACQHGAVELPAGYAEQIGGAAYKNLYDMVPQKDIGRSLLLAARACIERDPAFDKITAAILMAQIKIEVLGDTDEAEGFARQVKAGVAIEIYSPVLAEFDLPRLTAALKPERDGMFGFLGLQTLYDRYLVVDKTSGPARRIETPQGFFMRVAMGLAINEIERDARAIEFYNVLSSMDFMSSTPTLFNSGTRHPQLSSCYLTTVPDELDGIFGAVKENAMLQKYAGGLGNDWTPVRAMGSLIKGTNGESQGVIPFLKVVNDTAVAVNQCFAPETRVYSDKGAMPISSIKPGDIVLGISGTYRQVLKAMSYEQTDAMVEIRAKHGMDAVKVTSGHPIWAIRSVPMGNTNERTLGALDRGVFRADWIDAGKLNAGDYVGQVVPKEVVVVPGFDLDDARLYGIMLGDGHCTSDEREFGVTLGFVKDRTAAFVRQYLNDRGIRFHENELHGSCVQIKWAYGKGLVREGTTGRYVAAGGCALPFERVDLYDDAGKKRVAKRFSHLPLAQSIEMVRGLIETDGGVYRDNEVYFYNASVALVEGVRYQLLRNSVPTACVLDKKIEHAGTRADGNVINFPASLCYTVRVPAVKNIASALEIPAIEKKNWLEWDGAVFTRLKSVTPIAPCPTVHDLIVEGDESYMTTAFLAHNGGKRKGAVCSYLETWHLDIEEFLQLRKNTGDDRRRTHDMNTANWIPDLFMKRVMENGPWTLFSPKDVPDLHDLYGRDFEARYCEYEAKAARGELKLFKTVQATDLWRDMLTMLFETGHPWFTFKDPCNIRSPQQHVGVVHSSNLCSEITLNTSDSEIAVCNLGSVNLVNHMTRTDNGYVLDYDKVKRTTRTAMRMLDNVIDINYYAVKKARTSNLKHRPVGLGIMGFQDALHLMCLPYASKEAVRFASESMEAVCFNAYLASTELAKERGAYSSFKGSLWDRGVMPQDSLAFVTEARGEQYHKPVEVPAKCDWNLLAAQIREHGMRNSNCIAIAPTATISNIVGVSASIEPNYQNLYVKSNMSGEFTVINEYLVRDLRALGLWDELMIADLKYFDGALAKIDRVPAALKAVYATAFENDPSWYVEAASARQRWIDQAQSLNLYVSGVSGKKLDELYKLAWVKGLKTTYYLRTMAATSAEKSTGNGGELNAVSATARAPIAQAAPTQALEELDVSGKAGAFCSLEEVMNGGCESCQ
jgi:ribonucleoside-diphosphate reductase alpha chain